MSSRSFDSFRFGLLRSFDHSFVRKFDSCSFRFDSLRIILRADYSDAHIDKTTPTATLREQLLRRNIHRKLFPKLTVLLCRVVLFRWFKFNFKFNILDVL